MIFLKTACVQCSSCSWLFAFKTDHTLYKLNCVMHAMEFRFSEVFSLTVPSTDEALRFWKNSVSVRKVRISTHERGMERYPKTFPIRFTHEFFSVIL